MKEKVRQLWEQCFHDSPAFTDLYFRTRYSNEANIAIQSGESVIAALQMLPYPMTFCGKTINTSYISGACTHPDFRGKGVMRELLAESFGRMHTQGVLLSTLIPAEPGLFDYYTRSGYAPVFNIQTNLFTKDTDFVLTPDYHITVTENFTPQLYACFEQKMLLRPCCIQHTAEDFKVILADLRLSGGHIYLLHSMRQYDATTMAFVYPDGQGGLQIGELLSDSEEGTHFLLQHICQMNGQTCLRLLCSVFEKEKEEKLGMARIIDVHAVLQLFATAHPNVEWNLTITDEQLDINNGYYYLNNGHCMKSAKRLSGSHLSLTISELTTKILAPQHPYMSLMLNE